MRSISFTAVERVPEIHAGADLAATIAQALHAAEMRLAPRDILVVAHKVVSKAEGRTVDLRQVTPSSEAKRLAEVTGKDSRLVEVVLQESAEVVRAAPNVLIVRHRLGFVMANAGIDRSNVPQPAGTDTVLLLPRDPDASAALLRRAFLQSCAGPIGVIVSDSFGRPWRNGVVNVALGAAGLPALIDRRGEADRIGRSLEMTEVAFADAIAAGAALVMGEAAEGTPVVVARGLDWHSTESNAASLLRARHQDLFL